jgi:hypothetical protein
MGTKKKGGERRKLSSLKEAELIAEKKEKGRRRVTHCLFIFSQEQIRGTTCNPPCERKLGV